jgi:hypothetical protein
MLKDYKVGKAYEYFSSGWLQEGYFLKAKSNNNLCKAASSSFVPDFVRSLIVKNSEILDFPTSKLIKSVELITRTRPMNIFQVGGYRRDIS